MSNGKDELERWIDEGVRRYVGAEPAPGIEARVLAELEQRQHRRWWRPWMVAVPVAALLAIVIGVSLQEKTRPLPVAPQVSTAAPVTPAPPAPTPPQIATSATEHHERAAAQMKFSKDALTGVSTGARAQRPERFPAPEPPSEQELLLGRLAQNPVAAQTVAAKTAEKSENIVISRVAIDPVEIPLLPGPNQGE